MIRQRIKHFIIILTLALSTGGIAAPAMASASTLSKDACQGVAQIGGSCDQKSSTQGVNQIIKWVVEILSIIVGIAAVIMIIIGGIKFVTSGGDSNNVSEAKNTIMYALIGLVIVVLAQVLVHFVLDKSSAAANYCTDHPKSSQCK